MCNYILQEAQQLAVVHPGLLTCLGVRVQLKSFGPRRC
jgi:hypothetical protein